ncbi:hypothetical protein Tco_1425440 [Tanacetum coccineum]
MIGLPRTRKIFKPISPNQWLKQPDTIQLNLAEQKSRDELEVKQNVQKVEERLIAEEIEKLIEGAENVENVEVNSSTLRQDDTQTIIGTMLEPKRDKESPKVAIIVEVQLVNINKEEEESAKDDYELKQREKGKHVDESRSTPSPTTIRSLRTHSTLVSSDTKKLQELTDTDPPPSSSTPSSISSKSNITATNRLLSLFKPKPECFKRYKIFFDELQGRYGYLFEHLKTRFMQRKKFNVLAQHLQEIIEESLPTMVDDRSQADGAKMISDAIQQECKNLRSDITLQINNAISNHIPSQVDSSVGNYMSGHILHVHPTQATPTSVYEQQQQLYLTMRDNPQLQQDDLPIWLAFKYKFKRLHVATTPCRSSAVHLRDQDNPHDDVHLEGENSAKRKKTSEDGTFVFEESSFGQDFKSEQCPSTSVSQELVDEMSHTVDEAKLRKVVDEMLRQRCTSGDEHQYHIDQIQNFLKNNIVWESKKEILVP